ncbi:MAG TPA: response regulator [Opitutaceae bacterium]|nr:response regulator [Opitutaceae bacterium]
MKSPAAATVLVVDDTPANLGVVLELLAHAGLRVLLAESGGRALEILAQQPVDLVLLDVMMPGLDGFATFARMQGQPGLADAPVLFMTAVDEPAQKVRALEGGAVDYISKPLHPPEVLARVRTHLELRAARRALVAQNERLEAEVALRLDAEAQLAQSLDRALLVADRRGRLVFLTRRASNLLHRHFPGQAAGQLPPELRAGDRVPTPAGVLLVQRCAEQGNDQLTVFFVNEEHAPPGPAELLQLGVTPRQAEVLYWIAEGKTNAEIAIILGTSPRTVHKHVEMLYERLGVESRSGAIATAARILQPARAGQ